MDEDLLLQVFSKEDLSSLSQEQSSKFEKHLKSKQEHAVALEGKIQKLKADYEQKCYDLDKKLIESGTRLNNEASMLAKSTEQCKSLETAKLESERKCEALEQEVHEARMKITSLKRITEGWDEERMNLQHVIEKRDLEITRLNDEWKTLSDRMSEAISVKNELQIKLDELSSSNVTEHYHSKRVEQENELLTSENQLINQQLTEKNNELLALRKEKGDEIVSLQGRLEMNRNENHQLKQIVTNLKTNETTMSDKLNKMLEKSTKADEDHRSMEELHRCELQSQTRLAELYKSSAEDGERKAEELLSAVEELQSIVKSEAERNDVLQAKLNEIETQNTEQTIQIERLKKELETANDMITASKRRELSHDELAEMCPTAAMTSKFIKSGMTLTQIYSQYVEQSDELEVVKEENKRLNEAMDSILEELNAKAPILKRQREDYERALTTINQLTSQTDEAAMEFHQLRQDADDAKRKAGHLTRENQRYNKETADLSKQVRYLLKEVEELRGRRVNMSPQKIGDKSLLVVNEDGSCNDVSSSSELISQTLVTFKDIGELQEQNKKLLKVIRELSDKQEEAEVEGIDVRSRELQEELEVVKDELMHLKEDRTRQSLLVEGIVRQRDMYRVLLAQNPQSGLPPSVLASPSLLVDQSMMNATSISTPATPGKPTTPHETGSPQTTKKALLQLQDEYAEYKVDVIKNNKVYEDKQEDLQAKLSEVRISNGKLEAQVEFSKERYEMVKKNEESSKKECDVLREKNKQLYSAMQQHERTISNLNMELHSAQELTIKYQSRCDSIKSQLDISKRCEDRLNAENQSLQREQSNLSMLLSNLQKMQQSMEGQAFEVRSQLHSRLESQDRELIVLKQRVNDVTQEKQDAVQSIEKQLQVLQKALENEKMNSNKLSEDLKQTKLDLETLDQDKMEAETKLQIVEERLASLGGEDTDEDTTSLLQLRREIKQKSDEIINLTTRLEKARRHADHYKEVASASEDSLRQAASSNKELMTTLETRLQQSNEQQTKLEQDLAKLQEEHQSLKMEKYTMTGEVERQTADLRKQLVSVQSEFESSMRRTTEAITNERIAREDRSQQVAKAEEANDNYQREMILHSNAMKELIQIKEKLKSSDAEHQKLRLELSAAENSLKDKEESWKCVEEKLQSENQQQVVRVQEIEKQNETLHAQIQTMSGQLVELQSKVSKTLSPQKLYPSRDPVAAAEGGGAGSSNQQLLDVIKFLRREKEISDTKCELVQAEVVRCKHQLQHADEQMKQLQTQLSDQQLKVEEQSSKLSEHESLKREISHLRSVEERNKLLQEERDQLDVDLRSTNTRLSGLQADLAPLQTKNRELSAHCAALQTEKKAYADDVTRWKERVQQMTQSPRRQDPEEYRRLINEKTTLAKNLETMNTELTELKSECSALKGQIRNLQTNLQTTKLNSTTLEGQVASKEDEIKNLKESAEKQLQTMSKIRKVGRKFKLQYEELLAKQQKMDAEAKAAGDAVAVAAEDSDAVKRAEERCSKAEEDKMKIEEEVGRLREENQLLKSKQEEVEKNVLKTDDESKGLSTENEGLKNEVESLKVALDEKKKQVDEILEKEKRFSTLLSLAKSQIEKLRKDNQESNKERERLNNELKKMEADRKTEADQRTELQNKIEELQRQLLEGRHPPQVPEIRKTRSTTQRQRVNQVTPMRVTRTARVMPEPQQEAQDVERPVVVSSVPQAASSSTQAVVSQPSVVSVPVAPAISHATAFVHPMSPARQQHVVSSGSSTLPTQPQEQRDPGNEGNENDQAIVSSSDDQTNQSNDQNQPRVASSSVVVSSASQSDAPSSTGPHNVATTGATSSTGVSLNNPTARPFHNQGQKRSHDHVEDVAPSLTSRTSTLPGSSREAQVAVAPLPKRQRGSPDQSSESVSTVTVEQHDSESLISDARQPDQSQQNDVSENLDVENNVQDENDLDDYPQDDDDDTESSLQVASSSTRQQEVATSSLDPGDAEEMIVISSEEENSETDFEDQPDEEMANEEVDVEAEDQPDEEDGDESDTIPAITVSNISSVEQPTFPSSSLPFLVIQPEPSVRPRIPSRPGPAPLTPGIVMPSITEDGDGIVPCTPTLITHRHDEGYHAISSPRVPHAGGQPIRFRFEDLSSGNLFEPVPGGVGTVDNTLMDLAGAGEDNRSVPTTPVPQSTVIAQSSISNVDTSDLLPSTSGNAAVSSSIQEEELDVENDELEASNAPSVDRANELREASTIPTNTIRGRRRFRVIGAPRTRGRGANSPSTSNQP
nr:nucleoprotein TPR isoform X2 [Ciona intestinalis]|eukprot:XP_018671495.1 nucleoprotein TPR isoform X2 [Ciona intestinalis]